MENYDVVRALHHRREGSAGLLANVFNITSFYRFRGHEDRLLAQCRMYDSAQSGESLPNPSLVLLAAWDNSNKVFGSSNDYNADLTQSEHVLAQLTGAYPTTVYYEATSPQELLAGLREMPALFGQFASGSINSHGAASHVRFGEAAWDNLTLEDLDTQRFQNAFRGAYKQNAPFTISACWSYALAQKLSQLGLTTAGFLVSRSAITPNDFAVQGDTIAPTPRSNVALYQKGGQVASIVAR